MQRIGKQMYWSLISNKGFRKLLQVKELQLQARMGTFARCQEKNSNLNLVCQIMLPLQKQEQEQVKAAGSKIIVQ